MVENKTNIIREANALINASLIYGGETDTSPTADSSRKAFSFAFDRILGRHSWSSFTRSGVLNNSTDVPNDENYKYSKKFTLPENFFRPLNVAQSVNNLSTQGVSQTVNPDGTIPAINIPRIWLGSEGYEYASISDYEIRDNFIYVNITPVALTYIHNDIDNVAALPGNFRSALVFAIASFLATSGRSNYQLAEILERKYQQDCFLAIANDKLSYREENLDDGVYGGD